MYIWVVILWGTVLSLPMAGMEAFGALRQAARTHTQPLKSCECIITVEDKVPRGHGHTNAPKLGIHWFIFPSTFAQRVSRASSQPVSKAHPRGPVIRLHPQNRVTTDRDLLVPEIRAHNCWELATAWIPPHTSSPRNSLKTQTFQVKATNLLSTGSPSQTQLCASYTNLSFDPSTALYLCFASS